MNPLFKIRKAREKDDYGFIYFTWMNAFYYGNKWSKGSEKTNQAPIDLVGNMQYPTFFGESGYKKVIGSILNRSTATIQVAHLEGDEDSLIGHCVSEPGILHFVFVKDAWRKMGVAKALVPDNIHSITHLTKLGFFTKKEKWTYNPFLLMQ